MTTDDLITYQDILDLCHRINDMVMDIANYADAYPRVIAYKDGSGFVRISRNGHPAIDLTAFYFDVYCELPTLRRLVEGKHDDMLRQRIRDIFGIKEEAKKAVTIINFEDLVGQTLSSIENTYDEIVFTLDNGARYKLYHAQDCCESVYVEDVIGDLDDLVGTPLLMAEEVSNFEEPPFPGDYRPDSYTWTFYKLATIKGYVTIRWFGESNGYYSESVSFMQIDEVNGND